MHILKLLLAWLLAVLPLGWGVSKTIAKLEPLFTGEQKAGTGTTKP
jgi:hypothetical protein